MGWWYAVWLDMEDPQKNDCWTCLNVKQSFGVLASWKSLPDILQNPEESDWQTFNWDETVFQISLFMEKSAGYY